MYIAGTQQPSVPIMIRSLHVIIIIIIMKAGTCARS